jgi:DASS family divalent anion:Na+ symporter
VSLARLVGALEERAFRKGEVILREGAEANGLYLLERGEIAVTIRGAEDPEETGTDLEIATVKAPGHFGDMGVLLARRTATVRARTDVLVRRLPRDRFEQLVRERPEVALTVATSLAERFEHRQRALVGAPEPEVARPLTIERPRERRGGMPRRIAGAILAVAVPLALWWVAPPAGLDPKGWHVLLVLLGAAIAWLFEPVPDFVVAVALASAWGITGAGTLAAVFSGFATSTWILALGALSLAAAMARSGLLFRAGLFLLRAFPATHTGQVLALVTSGLALTALVPQSVARVAAIAPVTAELRVALGQPERSAGSAALAFAGIVGHWYFSNLFLTGFATNFFVLELVPAADRAAFGWWGWLVSSLVALIVCVVGATAALLVLFRSEHPASLGRDALARQLRVMAGFSRAERVTALAALVLVAGLLFQPVLGIEPAWLATATLVIAVAGVLGRDAFRTAVDWPFLLFLGILLGSGAVLQQAGIDRWLGATLRPLAGAAGHPGVVVLGLAFVVLLLRFVLPSRPTMLLMALVAMPAAPALGISPWVAGVVVLLAANTWALPYMGLEYLLLRDATKGEMFTDAQGTRMGIALIAVRLVAIAASVPYWMALGLIRTT